MRLIKMIGLAAVAAMAAMAFVGATSASAADTQLCTAHDALTCDSGEGATHVAMNNTGQGVVRLLSNFPTVLCLIISGLGVPLALANPQEVHVSDLLFGECGTEAAHENCLATVLKQPLALLNKTGLDTGTLTGKNGETLVECEDIDFFGTDIECTYDATGLQFSVGANLLHVKETPIKEIGSDFLCPNSPTLDGLLKTTANRYVLA